MAHVRLLRFVMLTSFVAAAALGCRTEGLAFRQDRRVEIVHPEDNAEVTLPFTLRWTVEDFRITGPDGSASNDAGYFAVFVDRTPMPPGEALSYIARDDESCTRTPGCPDEDYLNDRDIHLVSATELHVEALRDTRPVDRPGAADKHEITIVLLNGRSERIGEAAFTVAFTVDRGQD